MGHLERKTPSKRFPVGYVCYVMPESNLYKVIEKKFDRVVANFEKTDPSYAKFAIVRFVGEFFKVLLMDFVEWKWDADFPEFDIISEAYKRVLSKKILPWS